MYPKHLIASNRFKDLIKPLGYTYKPYWNKLNVIYCRLMHRTRFFVVKIRLILLVYPKHLIASNRSKDLIKPLGYTYKPYWNKLDVIYCRCHGVAMVK